MKYFLQIFYMLVFTLYIGIALAEPSIAATDPTIVQLTNPLKGNPDVNTIIGRVISGILGIVGSITLVAFVYGGFVWLTSAGNDGQVKKGLNTMVYAVIGLFIIFAAYAILNTIISALK